MDTRCILPGQEPLSSQMPDASRPSPSLETLVRIERLMFAAKVRAARAVLGWKQSELGKRAGLTQKSIHRIEQGTDDLRRSTVIAVEQVLKAEGVEFEDLPGGGFKVVVPGAVLTKHQVV
jgi:DNA-binding XRE family transcriptional regulator